MILGWSLDPDPDQYDIWHSSKTGSKEFNFISYNNPEVDQLLVKGRNTCRYEERKKSFFNRDIFVLRLYYYQMSIFFFNHRGLRVKDFSPILRSDSAKSNAEREIMKQIILIPLWLSILLRVLCGIK